MTYEWSGHRSNALLSAASVNTAGSYSPDGGYLSLTCKEQVNRTSLPIELQPRKQNASVSSRCQALEKLGGRAPHLTPPLTFPFAATSAGGGGGGLLCKCGCDLINRRAKWLSQSRLESITVISLSARSRFPPALQLSARWILNPHPFPPLPISPASL